MKTIYRLVFSLLALAIFAGCQNREEILEGFRHELAARMEFEDQTRTSLSGLRDGIHYPLWAAGDELAVFVDGGTQPVKYVLQSGEGTTEAVFSGTEAGTDYLALYPFQNGAKIENGAFAFSLPEKQQYAEGSFGQGAYPMVANWSEGLLKFKNLCAVIKISLTGKDKVNTITLKANDSKTYMSGLVSVPLSYTQTPELAMGPGGNNSVTLECNGVGLVNDRAKDFFIAVPAQTYKGGFTIKVETDRGNMEKIVAKDVVFDRSQIRELESFEFKLEGDIEPSKALQGEGTQSSPFLIGKLEDLVLMQECVNSQSGEIISASDNGKVDARRAFYKLTADIDLSSVCGKDEGNWVPIGDYSEDEKFIFGGTFDGAGHKITGLYIASSSTFQGLFGCLAGEIRNLSVDGTVTGTGNCGLVCGGTSDSTDGKMLIENCTSTGAVGSGNGYINDFDGFGGIVGSEASVYNCTNYATVKVSRGLVGGIIGGVSLIVKDCENYGDVQGSLYVGGIVGYQNAGRLYNCSNSGKAIGSYYVGGIAGYTRQSALLSNSCNKGEVEGRENVGGIAGMCDTYTHAPLGTKIINCVNVGDVKSTAGAASTGAICGYNVSLTSNCYWLYDAGTGKGMKQGIGITSDGAKSENCFALDASQMGGKEKYTGALYSSPDKTSYTYVLDALNAFAYDNYNSNILLSGWKGDNEDGFPVLTGEKPAKPEGESEPVFEVSEKEIPVAFIRSEIEISVRSNMDYYVSSMPEWITEVTTKAVSGAAKTVVHKFVVEENSGAEERKGVIVFCNEMQNCIPVTVLQKAKAEGDDWMSQTFVHRSLAMRFTADWCGYCPMMATAIDDARKQLQGNLEVLSVHASGGLYSDASGKLAQQFGVSSFPTGYVDGRVEIANYSQISYTTSRIIEAVQETEKKYEAVTGASWNSAIDGNKVTLDMKAYFKVSGSYKVTALLVEDNIVAYQAGASQTYNHKDVIRVAFSNALGDNADASAGQIKDFNYSLDIPAECNKENLRIVVYIQQKDTSGNYYVNNAVSAAVGKRQPLMVKSGNTGGSEGIMPDDDIPYNN